VTDECLEYALQYRIDHGVWGGASERERRRILRRRRTEVADPAAARRDALDRGQPVTIG
jgi:WhiB family redox-sensing transcriptional regulator